MNLEDILAERGLVWRDFCTEPYAILQDCIEYGVLYSQTKSGFFVFDKEDVIHVLMDGSNFPKEVPGDISESKPIREFFAKWIFYREDSDRSFVKRGLAKSLRNDNDQTLFRAAIDRSSLSSVYGNVRYAAFLIIFRKFFVLDERGEQEYFGHAEAVFSLLQSGRGFLNSSSVHHIDAFERLFLEPKKFEFDREFFGSGVLNSIIDGYEPLLDIIWNAVKIALHGPGLQGETAYAVALSVVPSFRYVVRHAQGTVKLPSGVDVGGKLFCFLSDQALKRSIYFGSASSLSFGRGRHICSGRGLVDEIVPHAVDQLTTFLRRNGVFSIDLIKSEGLGAEGIVDVKFNPSAGDPSLHKTASVR